MEDLERPVHLYVKTHRKTGLKYFGRTEQDPNTYRGSGAYWTRHLESYGNDVSTMIIGTFTDRAKLRAAAMSFSAEHDIATSTEWANLLPEDGDVHGAGWEIGRDYSARVAALDAAVRRRLDGTRPDGSYRTTTPRGNDANRFQRTFLVCLPLVAIAITVFFSQQQNFPADQWWLFLLLGLMTPLGWLPAAGVAWIVTRLSDSDR